MQNQKQSLRPFFRRSSCLPPLLQKSLNLTNKSPVGVRAKPRRSIPSIYCSSIVGFASGPCMSWATSLAACQQLPSSINWFILSQAESSCPKSIFLSCDYEIGHRFFAHGCLHLALHFLPKAHLRGFSKHPKV